MRAHEAFPGKYLKSADVKERPRIAVISHIEHEKVGKGADAEEKYVLYFEGDNKPMVLNRTNWDTLEDAFGDSNDWTGHKVKIKTARTQFQGKSIDGIRVEAIVPKPAASEELNDSLPDFDKKPAV
jgi:hypothetical protein